ncbi:hypothetical protein GQ53DRAFT_805766 [Thozetella sp. PMI_491]|nr:hypothetical protein GQ53DRAFT_805766 [Thozetella sp. PMI_491]
MMDVNRHERSGRRSAHRISPTACIACRQRRLPCGEERPGCLACIVYGSYCVYVPNTSQVAAVECSDILMGKSRCPPLKLLPSTLTGQSDVFEVPMRFRSSEVFYHFMNLRNSLAYLTSQETDYFYSSLGLVQTDRTWFQVALCMNAAFCCFRQNLYFQKTYLYHRQDLLYWLKTNIGNMNVVMPVHYLSVVACLAITDYAYGDDSGAQAHLDGLFVLLEARKKVEKEWHFYDALLRQTLVMALCLVFIARDSQSANIYIYGRDGCNPVIASMYSQLANEFLRTALLAGNPYAIHRTDGPVLAWLYEVLRGAKPSKFSGQKLPHHTKLDRQEEQLWRKTMSVYALTVGNLDWAGVNQTNWSRSSAAFPELSRLRRWWSDVMNNWAASGAPMTVDIARKVWQKVEWLETDEGAGLAYEIALVSLSNEFLQYDGYAAEQEPDQKRLALAPGLMYI